MFALSVLKFTQDHQLSTHKTRWANLYYIYCFLKISFKCTLMSSSHLCRCIAVEKTLGEAISCLDGEEADTEVIDWSSWNWSWPTLIKVKKIAMKAAILFWCGPSFLLIKSLIFQVQAAKARMVEVCDNITTLKKRKWLSLDQGLCESEVKRLRFSVKMLLNWRQWNSTLKI